MGGSAFGKRSTPRSRNEKTPSTTRNSISIVVNTGRRTQTSANVIFFFSYPHLRCLEFATVALPASIEHGCATVFWQEPRGSGKFLGTQKIAAWTRVSERAPEGMRYALDSRLSDSEQRAVHVRTTPEEKSSINPVKS